MSQTHLGPLTTTFVAPTTRVSSFAHIYVSVDGGVYAGPFSTGACLPSSYDNPRSNFYSPGICPSGFTPACSWTTALGSATETAVTCCPYFESSYEPPRPRLSPTGLQDIYLLPSRVC